MSEQPNGHHIEHGPTPDQDDPPPPQDAPVAGGDDDGPPAQGEGAPDSW